MKLAPAQYVMSLRLPPELAYATERGARATGVTISAYIRSALERTLKADGIEVNPIATPAPAPGAGTGTEGE